MHRTAASAVALAACSVLGGCSDAPAPGKGGARPDVLLISIDTLRPDHLGCYGYAPYARPVSPAIDALAAEGVLFERCFAPRGQTGPSLCSMLTGLYPSGHGILDNNEGLREEGSDLVDDFVELGYEVHGFVSLLPVKKSTKQQFAFARFAPGRGSWFDAKESAPQLRQVDCDDAVEAAYLERLARRRGAERPSFTWLHFYDVHQPYAPPAAFHEAFAGDYRGSLRLDPAPTGAAFNSVVKTHLDQKMVAREPLDPADARYVTALYDGGIAAADVRIGRIVEALRRAGRLDRTLICITADHGEELGEHNGFWFHGNSLYDAVLRIPLVVRGPGVTQGRCDALMQNLDLLPTLLELVGGKVPAGIDGFSFAELARGGRPTAPPRDVAWAEFEDVILAARTREWKLIRNPRGARPKLPPYHAPDDAGYFSDCKELYDLLADPREQRNVWREKSGAVEELRRAAEDEQERRFAGLERGAVDPVSEAERRELEALGYTAPSADGARSQNYRLDPASCDE